MYDVAFQNSHLDILIIIIIVVIYKAPLDLSPPQDRSKLLTRPTAAHTYMSHRIQLAVGDVNDEWFYKPDTPPPPTPNYEYRLCVNVAILRHIQAVSG